MIMIIVPKSPPQTPCIHLFTLTPPGVVCMLAVVHEKAVTMKALKSKLPTEDHIANYIGSRVATHTCT